MESHERLRFFTTPWITLYVRTLSSRRCRRVLPARILCRTSSLQFSIPAQSPPGLRIARTAAPSSSTVPKSIWNVTHEQSLPCSVHCCLFPKCSYFRRMWTSGSWSNRSLHAYRCLGAPDRCPWEGSTSVEVSLAFPILITQEYQLDFAARSHPGNKAAKN